MDVVLKEIFRHALELEKSEKWQEALNTYKSILRKKNDHFESWLNAGAIFFRLKQTSKAVQCYQKCLTIKEDERANYNLGVVYYQLRDFKNAVQQFQECLRLNENQTQAYLLLSYSYIEIHDFNKAIFTLKKALAKEPQNESLLVCLAISYYESSNFSLCDKVLNQVFSVNPENKAALKIKAEISLMDKVSPEAIENFRKLMQTDAKVAEIESLMMEPRNKKTFDKMTALKTQLNQKNLKDPKDYLDLSLISFLLGNGNAAMNYLLYSVRE